MTMKTRRNNHLLQTTAWLIASLMVCFACTDDELITATNGTADNDVPAGYYFVLADSNTPGTRVSYTDTQHSDFEDGDLLGIYAIDEAGNRVTTANGENVPPNACYRVVTVKNINGSTRQVLENVNEDMPTGLRYVLYYPYDSNMTFERLSNLTFTVRYNQNAANVDNYNGLRHEVTAYEASDLLWDVAQAADGQNYVNIEMEHAMANIILNISEEYLQPSGEDVYNVFVTNCQTRASGIDLRTTWADNESFPDNDITNWSWKYTTSRNERITYQQVRMWNTGLTSSGMLCFRAAIPACQTIPAGTALFSIAWTENGANSPKTFSSKEALTLKPGKNYIFTVMKQADPDQPVIPDVTDDDSWVLDVLDPETGEPVGLLCREYLRYQPVNTSNVEEDKITGITDGTANITSQAWVFYNLKDYNTYIPNLNEGTILRFIYDVRANGNGIADTQNNSSLWPLPHHYGVNYGSGTGGLFTPYHGHTWVDSNEEPKYGTSSSEFTENYMHGGKITWGIRQNDEGKNYYGITSFTIDPNTQITNQQARKGHIAIIKENGEIRDVKVSYNNESASNNSYKVGIIVPQHLIDRRINKRTNEIETKLYPLVKIGYNNFWISKGLKTHLLIDGTTLTCYNQSESPYITFNNGGTDILEAGFLFPHSNEYDFFTESENLDDAPVLYNFTAINSGLLLPISPDNRSTYYMPTQESMQELLDYFGWRYAAKLMTSAVRTRNQSDYNETEKEALAANKIVHANYNFFAANISGFNMKSNGSYRSDAGNWAGLGFACTMWLQPTENLAMHYVSFNAYDVFNQTITNFFNEANPSESYKSRTFFGLRILLKMNHQADTGGSASTFSTRSTTVDKERTRNIYVPLISK